MRWLKAPISFILALNICALLVIPPTQAREMSKAGEVFQRVQNGVVSIFTSASSGSGFLADARGLIVTNSHVIKECGDNLRVKFSPGKVVEATVVARDRENDVAIIRVNLKNIEDFRVIPLFSSTTDTAVLVGEHVIAIGSPMRQRTYEKLMTLGVVGKCDGKAIFHDAKINHGNSGGPLLNYDGEVVGINAFAERDHNNTGPSGAIPISYAAALLDGLHGPLEKTKEPSEELLPEASEENYPISQLLREQPEFFTKRKQERYTVQSEYFTFTVLTPPQLYSQSIKRQDRVLQKRKKRARAGNFAVTDDEYDYKNRSGFYTIEEPVVTILAFPKPKLTTSSAVLTAMSFLGAASLTAASGGILAPLLVAPLAVPQDHEYKRDFLRLALVGEDGKEIDTPIATGRKPIDSDLITIAGLTTASLIDKSYCGIYKFKPSAFDSSKKLSLVVGSEDLKKKTIVVKFPEKVKALIHRDFEPYEAHLDALAQKSSNKQISTSSISPAE